MKQTPAQSAIDDFNKKNSLIARIESLYEKCDVCSDHDGICQTSVVNGTLDDVLKIVREEV